MSWIRVSLWITQTDISCLVCTYNTQCSQFMLIFLKLIYYLSFCLFQLKILSKETDIENSTEIEMGPHRKHQVSNKKRIIKVGSASQQF